MTDCSIRPALNGDIDSVHALAYASCVRVGQCRPNASKRHIYHAHLEDPTSTVLLATIGPRLCGSASYTFDGAKGIDADVDFRPQVDVVRQEERRLAGVWRIVTARGNDRKMVVALLREATRRLIDAGVQTYLIVADERHDDFYARLFGAQTIGQKNARDTAAYDVLGHSPNLVLMRFDRERINGMELLERRRGDRRD